MRKVQGESLDSINDQYLNSGSYPVSVLCVSVGHSVCMYVICALTCGTTVCVMCVMCVYIYMCVCVCVCMCVCVCVCLCVCVRNLIANWLPSTKQSLWSMIWITVEILVYIYYVNCVPVQYVYVCV